MYVLCTCICILYDICAGTYIIYTWYICTYVRYTMYLQYILYVYSIVAACTYACCYVYTHTQAVMWKQLYSFWYLISQLKILLSIVHVHSHFWCVWNTKLISFHQWQCLSLLAAVWLINYYFWKNNSVNNCLADMTARLLVVSNR